MIAIKETNCWECWECVCMCDLRWLNLSQELLHCAQLQVFFPLLGECVCSVPSCFLCISSCAGIIILCATKGFLPECVRMCVLILDYEHLHCEKKLRVPASQRNFSHVGLVHGLSQVWLSKWCTDVYSWAKCSCTLCTCLPVWLPSTMAFWGLGNINWWKKKQIVQQMLLDFVSNIAE